MARMEMLLPSTIHVIRISDGHIPGDLVIDKGDIFQKIIHPPAQKRMIRSLWRFIRDPEDVADALQEVLVVIWKRLERIQNHPNPDALILKICLNKAYDLLRQKRRHQTQQLEAQPDPIAENQNQVNQLQLQETQSQVLTAITRLPRKQAVAVLMRIIHEEPYSSIARAMNCKETTARIHVSRGRTRLSRLLADLKNKTGETDDR